MKGPIEVEVYDENIKYKFTIRRNITVVKGNSATGKTTLISMLRDYNLGDDTKTVICDKPCLTVLPDEDWEGKIKKQKNSILFFDEDCRFTNSGRFAELIEGTSNYYVIVSRRSLNCLPYSINEIYEIVEDKRYPYLKQTYNVFKNYYGEESGIIC